MHLSTPHPLQRFFAALCCSVIFLFTQTGTAEDWPQWQGPRRNSTWRAPTHSTAIPFQQLRPTWSAPLHSGYSGVSVANNLVITLDRPTAPSDHERVVCFDSQSGKQLWKFTYNAPYGKLDYPKGPRAAPTIHAGRVYSLGAVGHLHCLDAITGLPLWSKDLVKDLGAVISTWGFASAPLIHNHVVIIHAGAPRNGCFIAFDQITGQERWRAGADPLGYGTPILAHDANRLQLIAWTPENILGLAPEDGTELWRIPYKVTYGVSIATPLVANDIVLVCGYWEGSKAIRLGPSPRDAQLLWEENRFLRGLMSPPLYRDRHVYLLDKQHGLVCFELTTGKMVWTDQNKLTPRDRNPHASIVWLDDSSEVIALNTPGELIHARLTPTGYEELGRVKILGETWAHPAFAGDACYARDDQQLVKVPLYR